MATNQIFKRRHYLMKDDSSLPHTSYNCKYHIMLDQSIKEKKSAGTLLFFCSITYSFIFYHVYENESYSVTLILKSQFRMLICKYWFNMLSNKFYSIFRILYKKRSNRNYDIFLCVEINYISAISYSCTGMFFIINNPP